jgi:hypothetical protein
MVIHSGDHLDFGHFYTLRLGSLVPIKHNFWITTEVTVKPKASQTVKFVSSKIVTISLTLGFFLRESTDFLSFFARAPAVESFTIHYIPLYNTRLKRN